MQPRQWVNQSQPQTLQVAVILLYLNGLSMLLSMGLLFGGISLALLLLIGQVVGGFGIANEKKWGYLVGLVSAAIVTLTALAVVVLVGMTFGLLLKLVFDIAVVALLLHPLSRSYQRIWFR